MDHCIGTTQDHGARRLPLGRRSVVSGTPKTVKDDAR